MSDVVQSQNTAVVLTTQENGSKLSDSQNGIQLHMQPNEKIDHILFVTSIEWDKASHGLFDYESSSLKQSQWAHKAIGSSFIVRKYDNNKLLQQKYVSNVHPSAMSYVSDENRLLSIVYKNGLYWAYQP